MSIPRKIELVHTDEEFEELKASETYWRKAYIELETRHDTKYAELEHEFEWLKDLNANNWLSGDHKIVLWEIRCIIRRMRYDLSIPVHIWMSEIENRTGLSDRTVKRIVQELHDVGLITKDTRGKGKGQKTWFSFGGEIRTSAKNIAISAEKRNHGGERVRCKKCKGENLQPIGYKCLDCGCQWTL